MTTRKISLRSIICPNVAQEFVFWLHKKGLDGLFRSLNLINESKCLFRDLLNSGGVNVNGTLSGIGVFPCVSPSLYFSTRYSV